VETELATSWFRRARFVQRVRHSALRLYGIVDEEQEERIFAAAPLGNHQLAAILFFQSHGLIESHDGALRLLVRRRLSSDALQP